MVSWFFLCAVMQSRDPSTNVVLLEDTAAVLGVILAAGCMGLTSITGKQITHGDISLFLSLSSQLSVSYLRYDEKTQKKIADTPGI